MKQIVEGHAWYYLDCMPIKGADSSFCATKPRRGQFGKVEKGRVLGLEYDEPPSMPKGHVIVPLTVFGKYHLLVHLWPSQSLLFCMFLPRLQVRFWPLGRGELSKGVGKKIK